MDWDTWGDCNYLINLDSFDSKTIAKNIFKRFNRGEESDIFDFLISSEKNINKIPDISDFLYLINENEIFYNAGFTLHCLHNCAGAEH